MASYNSFFVFSWSHVDFTCLCDSRHVPTIRIVNICLSWPVPITLYEQLYQTTRISCLVAIMMKSL